MDFKDPELQETLQGRGKEVGKWSVNGSLASRGGKITESDIPMSFADGGGAMVTGIELAIYKKCQVKEMHFHDGKNPAVHFHVECDDATGKGGDEIAHLIALTNNVSRRAAGLPIKAPDLKLRR